MEKENIKTLIVDDHMIMRNVVEKHINAMGIRNVTFAVNGQEAAEKAQQETFDIILADWNMPELSGEDLLKKIRDDIKYNKSAFVMISAEGEKTKILDVMNAGATAYLTKPFSEGEFQDTISNVISWLEKKRN